MVVYKINRLCIHFWWALNSFRILVLLLLLFVVAFWLLLLLFYLLFCILVFFFLLLLFYLVVVVLLLFLFLVLAIERKCMQMIRYWITCYKSFVLLTSMYLLMFVETLYGYEKTTVRTQTLPRGGAKSEQKGSGETTTTGLRQDR